MLDFTIRVLDALAAVFLFAAAVAGIFLYALLIVFLVTQVINHMPSEGGN